MGIRQAVALMAIVVGSATGVVGCGDGDVPSSGVRPEDPAFLAVYLVETGAIGSEAPVYIEVLSPTDDAIVGVAIAPDIAAGAELRSAGLATSPGSVIERIELQAGAAKVLAVDGDHVRLVGLAEPLRRNDIVDLDLSFEHAGDRRLRVVVRDARVLNVA